VTEFVVTSWSHRYFVTDSVPMWPHR